MMQAIVTRDLVKSFGSLTAVDNLSLEIEEGCMFGLIGPNGAGKTTTLNMLTGLLPPASGTVELLGRDYRRSAAEIKRDLGIMRAELGLYEQLTGEEYLFFVGRAFGLDRDSIRSRSLELFDFMDLAADGARPIHQYSTGMKKKLCMASILLHEPRILFLDEPFEGIDPISAAAIRDALQMIAERGGTILLTSHILERVERLCTDVGILDHGKLVLTSSMADVRRAVSEKLSESGDGALEALFMEVVDSDADSKRLSWL